MRVLYFWMCACDDWCARIGLGMSKTNKVTLLV